MDFLKRRGNLLLFIAEGLLTLIGILYLADTVVFINTKQIATAMVVRVEVNKKLPQPYKATMVYHNDFINNNVVSYVDNIGTNYAKKHIDVNNHLEIYYRNYFPREIYLTDYKFPNGKNVAFASVYILVFSGILYVQSRRINKQIEKF
ncbi:hypothetical protein [Mucilaginibacter glaciei]|uniref:DUF3592 domain-containing protein n=1 Tax=Mucilaginibacter glaciei TaxID=2772109 RepID=A0A926S415_9SPHI|nr:hypothetical protein [Mucilaginibacter glaciei]MBD1394809.1 hypothetical protein [Mucilaginibacter glaciei]